MSAVKKFLKRSGLYPYWSLFRMRTVNGLQYRAAAAAGIATQFFWGIIEILVFVAFYQGNEQNFPMEMQALASYLWLQQAFLMLFEGWGGESEIYDLITSGNVAYELCRPVRLYAMWSARTMAYRLSRAALRCLPVLAVAACLPAPYGLSLPKSPAAFGWFLLSMLLAFLLNTANSVLIYILCFFTIDARGIRIVSSSLHEFFSGAVIPLPFLPGGLRAVAELLPYAGMQNMPLRIYGGDIAGAAIGRGILLQIIWLLAFYALGKLLIRRALRRTVIQGG